MGVWDVTRAYTYEWDSINIYIWMSNVTHLLHYTKHTIMCAHLSYLCVRYPTYVCGLTHRCVRHDSRLPRFTSYVTYQKWCHVTSHVELCHATIQIKLCVRPDASMCATWLTIFALYKLCHILRVMSHNKSCWVMSHNERWGAGVEYHFQEIQWALRPVVNGT